MKLITKIENKLVSIYFLTFFLLRLPPINLVPNKDIALINSQSIARYLIFLIFILLLRQNNLKLQIGKRSIFFSALYFITISLSILTAINIQAFLEIYKHIAFGLLFFWVTLVVLDNKKKVQTSIKILFVTIIINFSYQFFIYFYRDSLSNLQGLFYGKYWEVLNLNMIRKRFFVDIYDSALVPLVFLFFLGYKNIFQKKFYQSLIIITTFFFAVISNFRTQLVMVLTSTIGSLWIFSKNINLFFIKAVGFVIILFLFSNFLGSFIPFNTVIRITEPTEAETMTLVTRYNWWQQSIDMGNSSPLFGVGINNFYEYLNNKPKPGMTFSNDMIRLAKITAGHPHNVFFQSYAETGILGLVSFLLLLSHFIFNDIKSFMKSDKNKLIIISFWSLFIFGIFNPPITLQYIILFWFLRILIIKFKQFSI